MTPKMARRALLILIVWLGACGPSPESETPGTVLERASPGHNLLLISLDTVRADRLGAYGYPRATTPNLDALARQGLRFDQASTTAPLTLPSHASLLSGLLPPHHGLRLNGQGRFPGDLETLATHFEAVGYDTAAFVAAFVLDRRFGLDRGFALYDDRITRPADGQIRLEAERPADQVVDAALAWLGTRDTRPFFAWIHLYDAHAPYDPPPPYDQAHADHPYDGEVAFVDAQVGRLLEALEAQQLADETLVVVVGDHGESLGEHGEASHGLLLYESVLRIPWLMRGPGLDAGTIVHTPVSLIDVAPTAAALVQRPFTPKATSETEGYRGRDLALAIAHNDLAETALYAETLYPATLGWSPLASLRRGSMKSIVGATSELFDLASDPGETIDLTDQNRPLVRRLTKVLESLQTSSATRPQDEAPQDAETRARLTALGYIGTPSLADEVRLGQGADPRQRIDLFRRWEFAHRDLEGGQVDRAAPVLSELLAEDPENPVFLSSLAQARRKQGQTDAAIDLQRRLTQLRPDDAGTWYDLAAAYKEIGRHRDAIEAGREALRRDPQRPEGLNLLGISYLEEGDFEHAIEHFELALKLDPRDPTVHNNLGNALRAIGHPTEAEAAYRRAQDLAPSYADPWNGLGTLVIERNPVQAIEYFDRALVITPEFHEARLNRGIAYQMAGQTAEAADEYRRLLATVPQEPHHQSLRQAASTLLENLH